MKAMILAAGKGERLRPLTEILPKPALPIGNFPLLLYTATFLKAAGVTEVGINLHHLAPQVRRVLGDGSESGLRITYSDEPVLLGTAGGIKKLEPFWTKEPFFVMNGDTLISTDLGRLLDFHNQVGSALTLALRKDPQAASFGLVGVDEEGRICRFRDHKMYPEKQPCTEYMFSGVHFWEPELLSEIPCDVPWDFSRQLFPHLLERGFPLYGFPVDGYWSDIGTPQRYLNTHWDLLKGEFSRPGFSRIDPESVTRDGDSEIASTARLKPPVLLGAGCSLEENTTVGPWVVMGPGVRIEAGASVTRTVLWSEVCLGRGTLLEDSIVASRCQVPPGQHYRGHILISGRGGELLVSPLKNP